MNSVEFEMKAKKSASPVIKQVLTDVRSMKGATDDAAKSADDLGKAAKSLTSDFGDVNNAVGGTTATMQWLAGLLQGIVLAAINNVTKGLKFLWLEMLKNPLTALLALFQLLLPLLVDLAKYLFNSGAAGEKMAESLKKMEKDGNASAKALEDLSKAKLDAALAEAKSLADEWDRLVKEVHEYQAAQDMLKNAKMAQELAGIESAKEVAMGRVRGDKDGERRTELEFEKQKADVRLRYEKADAKEKLSRAVTERALIGQESNVRNDAAAIMRNEANRTEAVRAEMAGRLGGLDIWGRNGELDPDKAKAMQESLWKESAKTGSLVHRFTAKDIGDYPKTVAAAAKAKAEADKFARENAIQQSQLTARRTTAQMAVEAAQYDVRRVSSATTASQFGFQNRGAALESTIAGEHASAAERERQRLLREQQMQRSSLASQYRERGGDIIRRNELGMRAMPQQVQGAYREQEREALERVVTAVKEGKTSDLINQLNEAIRQRNQTESNVLREAIRLMSQISGQRVNDPRR